MTDARQLLDDYASHEIWGGYDVMTPREEHAPKAFAALRAVLTYCDEVERTKPITAMELRGRVTSALRDGGDSS